MKMREMFPSNWLKGEELKGKGFVKVVIAGGSMEEMPDGGQKPVLRFQGASKGLVLNKTNGDEIAEAYGEDTDDWIGKSILLYFDPKVSYAGKRTGGIRVRIPTPKRAPEPEPEEPMPDEDDAPLPDDEPIQF
jgi:hypothetical protein